MSSITLAAQTEKKIAPPSTGFLLLQNYAQHGANFMNKNVRKRCWSSCYYVSSCHFNIINSPWYPFSVISAPSVVREIRFPIRYPWYPSLWYPLYPLSVVSESMISALSVVHGIRLRVSGIRLQVCDIQHPTSVLYPPPLPEVIANAFCNGCVRLPNFDLSIISLSVRQIIVSLYWITTDPYAVSFKRVNVINSALVAMETAAVRHYPTVQKT